MTRTALDAGRVRAWRKRHGLTQAQAAVLAGVNERSWRRWELGERQPPDMLLHFMRVWEAHDQYRVTIEGRTRGTSSPGQNHNERDTEDETTEEGRE